MRFTRPREEEVLATLAEDPEAHIVFPPRAYRPDGRILITRDGRSRFMTRYLFELLIQPDFDRLPGQRLFLLQQCAEQGCQNPYHYAAFASPNGAVAITNDTVANAVKTHCLRGHPFTPKNTHTDRRGKRVCRACDRDRVAANRARKASA